MDSLLGFSALAIASGQKVSQMWASIPSPASTTQSTWTATLPIVVPFILATAYSITSNAASPPSLQLITNGVVDVNVKMGGYAIAVTFNEKDLTLNGNVQYIKQFSAIYPL